MDGDLKKDRAIIKFLTSRPWAITPDALDTIQEVVVNHLEGINVEMASPGAKPVGHVKYPEVAIIQLHGTVAKRLHGLDAISGGTTTLDWQESIQAALDDTKIKGIVLDMDSPGGTVDGTKELADFIMSAKEQKPIIGYGNGQMCSAMYWIGSACTKLVAFDTAQVGSIGVIITHRDFSAQEKMMGVKTTHIYAGKYKSMASPSKPLDKESEKYLQDSVDFYYTMFVDAVATQRGVTVEQVLGNMAEGRVFIGKQSLEVGLVDLIGNLEDAIKLTKQGGNKVTIQEAVKEFGAMNLLSHMVSTNGSELPKSVVDAYVESSTPKLEIPAELQSVIDTLTAKVDTLETEKQTAEQTLDDERVATAQENLAIEVAASLKTIKLEGNEAFTNLGVDIGMERFTPIIDHIATLRSQLTEVASELHVETEDATSESNLDEDSPVNFDAACNFVEKRDGCDIEKAVIVAAKEFPDLYAKSIEGGN